MRRLALVLLLLGLAADAAASGASGSSSAGGSSARAKKTSHGAAAVPPLRGPEDAPATSPQNPVNQNLSEAVVAVFEYRTAVAQVADLSERLSSALHANTSLKVVDPREGRRRYGVKLDADVAACAGEMKCIAQIGGRVGATEVLLFAVSQLGDVVLALQRLDVASNKVVARLADSLPTAPVPEGAAPPSGAALSVVVDETRVMGWLQQLYPPEVFKRYGRIAVSSELAGARVYVNNQPRGETPLREPLSVLAPGSYRLLVEKPRYLAFNAQLTVMPDTTVEVTAKLPLAQAPTPWYKRWYVWAAVGAGAAVAASGVAIYYGAFYKGPPDMTRIPTGITIK